MEGDDDGGGSSSSADNIAATSACEQSRKSSEPEKKKRRVRVTSSSDGDEPSGVVDAINNFAIAYMKIETTKLEAKRAAVDLVTHKAKLALEMSKRCRASMLDAHLATVTVFEDAVKAALERHRSRGDGSN